MGTLCRRRPSLRLPPWRHPLASANCPGLQRLLKQVARDADGAKSAVQRRHAILGVFEPAPRLGDTTLGPRQQTTPTRLMTLIVRPLRVVLAVAAVVICASALTLAGVPGSAPAGANFTALPAGWELCVLQGTGAPATPDNVADLDGWQIQEGGSTNNTAAYNPFNTARTTDVSGANVPTVASSGFPAFANWLAGCAATVATLLQPNMATIAAALRAGNVAPSASFLALVDQSQWCAPSPDGVPCYANAILGSASNLAGKVLSEGSALDVYGNVKADLYSWQLANLAVAADKHNVVIKNQQLGAARSATSSMRAKFLASERMLRNFAVDEYVSTGLYVSSSYLDPPGHKMFGPPTPNGVVAQQYESVAASDVLARTNKADGALRASEARREQAARALQQAVSTLSADTAAENQALIRMVADVATMQTAGACTAATITVSGPTTTPGPATTTVPAATPTTTTTTTTTTTAPAATPTTTTTVPPSTTTTTSTSTTTTTSSTTTTTTTVPSSTTTTSSTSTTTTTTAPAPPAGAPTTTTTSAPSTTTTTTPAPSQANTPAPTANPVGIQALQGCVASLAPQTPSTGS
jgi:hypothetical protein